MRVLLTVPCLAGSGAEFVAAKWAQHLAEQGDEVTVYTTHATAEDVAPERVSMVRAGSGRFLANTREFAQYLRAHPVDVVVALMPYWNLMSIAAACTLGRNRPKVVVSGHNFANGLRSVHGRSYRRMQWLARRMYRFADLFIAVSHPVGAEAVAEYRIAPDRIVVIPNPALAKLQDRLADLTVRPAADPGQLNIVVPARLIPQKRPLIAVDVAAALMRVVPGGVTLHYYGLGSLDEAIVTRARELGVSAVLHGWVPNWFDDCPAGSVVLLTSVAEGFGNVLIEAAAAGYKSVVSSRCMGSADAVIPGITGELTAGDSVDDYAIAVLAASRGGVRDVGPWLRRFSSESSGGILRDQLLRTVGRQTSHVAGIKA